MRICEIIKEAATSGATGSGNIATVSNPAFANPSRKTIAYTGTPGVSGKGPVKQVKVVKQKPTDNALNKNDSLFGAGVIKRNKSTPLAALHAGKLV